MLQSSNLKTTSRAFGRKPQFLGQRCGCDTSAPGNPSSDTGGGHPLGREGSLGSRRGLGQNEIGVPVPMPAKQPSFLSSLRRFLVG